jgi:hypothetical protein
VEATSRFGNPRNRLLGREAPFVFFTRRPGYYDKDAGVGNSLHWASTGAFIGGCSIAATADARRKHTCGVAAGGPRVRFYREELKDATAEPGAELAVAQGAVRLIVDVIWTRKDQPYQLRCIDIAKWSSKAVPGTTSATILATTNAILAKTRTRMTAPKATDLVRVDAGHDEEEDRW